MKKIEKNNTQPLSKRSLFGHTWLGIAISAFMYIICLSGTIAVFHHELERWEQPDVVETISFEYEQLEKSYDNFVAQYPEETEHMHMVFPTSGIPRLVVENDHTAHFVNEDGSLGQIEKPYWTKMLVDLHLYLHLPNNFGIILVSACGALLCALILSGFIAHPRIVKDAFRFRRGGNRLQENIDLHNRFSVWASPFHLMIAVTGAYFGLASIFIVVVSQAYYNGDTQAVVDRVFTPEPELKQTIKIPEIVKAVKDVQQRSPDGKLIFMTVHEPHTPGQFMEFYVKQPGRLIYSENYRYDVDGNFLEVGGYADGEVGKQLIYSLYRLHFGDFGGIPSKILYFVLGMMLTVISATGITIWLSKRKSRDIFNQVWPALVWGVPIALVSSAAINLLIQSRIDLVLWVIITLSLVAALRINEERISSYFKNILALSIGVLIVAYVAKFGAASLNIAALQINVPMLVFALYLLSLNKQKTDNFNPD